MTPTAASRDGTSIAVVQAVADETGIPPMDLPPLYEAVEPDVVELIAQGDVSGEISFEYADCNVRVRSDGTVDVRGGPEANDAGEADERSPRVD